MVRFAKKMRNVEVDRKNLLNSLSVFGLKLERILTLLYKKKKDPQFESINSVKRLIHSPNQGKLRCPNTRILPSSSVSTTKSMLTSRRGT